MYEPLDDVDLKSGETVQCGAVLAPDADWARRLCDMLGHKGEPWDWQNDRVLRAQTGVEARYYVLHRDGDPLANILVAEGNGVGLLGHVWTCIADRRKGAASRLMGRLLDHFRGRGGRALYLCTDYDTAPYHIYRRHGFESIEPGSGVMHYFAAGEATFLAEHFADGPARIEGIGWKHWPDTVLAASDLPGAVRCAPLQMIGRCTTEGLLLPAIRAAEPSNSDPESAHGEHVTPRAVALVNEATDAVVGIAAWSLDPTWRGRTLVDVYCHPSYWSQAPDMIARLSITPDRPAHAYADTGAPGEPKRQALQDAGFARVATLPGLAAADASARGFVDVDLLVRP